MYVRVEQVWCGARKGAGVLNQGWGVEREASGWPPLSSGSLQLEVVPWAQVVTSTPALKAEPAIIPATRNEPIGLKASDFLPVSGVPAQGWGGGP